MRINFIRKNSLTFAAPLIIRILLSNDDDPLYQSNEATVILYYGRIASFISGVVLQPSDQIFLHADLNELTEDDAGTSQNADCAEFKFTSRFGIFKRDAQFMPYLTDESTPKKAPNQSYLLEDTSNLHTQKDLFLIRRRKLLYQSDHL
jgi:hypothetical protein